MGTAAKDVASALSNSFLFSSLPSDSASRRPACWGVKLEGAPGLQQEMTDQQCLVPRRRTKRWEAHIWDDKKQVYLGGFDVEEHAGDYPCSRVSAAFPVWTSNLAPTDQLLRCLQDNSAHIGVYRPSETSFARALVRQSYLTGRAS